MKIVDYDPTQGMAFQGDIVIIPLPASIKVSTVDEIRPVDGCLIIQEGEATGHHHAIELPRARHFRDDTRTVGDPSVVTKSPRLRRVIGGVRSVSVPVVHLYRDPLAIAQMQELGILTRTDLAIGILLVTPSSEVVVHEEHDGIRVPGGDGSTVTPNLAEWCGGYLFGGGCYYVGRQVESASVEDRLVHD